MKKFIRFIATIFAAVILAAAALFGFLSVTEFKPESNEKSEVTGSAVSELEPGNSFSIVTWNIGYGALGDNADFFMDGGKSVRTADSARLNANLNDISDKLSSFDADIVFLQEVDRNSSRSGHVDELAMISMSLDEYDCSFANNFKVAFLPYPLPPIGKVDSGIATFSAYAVSSAERIQLPVPFSWPVSMVNLKRCLLCSRIPVKGTDKELVLFNLHLEAYDDGEGKIAQTKMLAELLKAEIEKGNYVIAGGDFNQVFSTTDISDYPVLEGKWAAGEIDVSKISGGFSFLMDNKTPSCRSLDQPYKNAEKENFQYYVIDGFIVYADLVVESFETRDLGFVSSDHNPVVMQVKLPE